MNCSFLSDKLEKRSSLISGIGIFAREFISKNEIVAIKIGNICHIKNIDLCKYHDYSLQIEDNFILCSFDEKEIDKHAIYINHSCDPNVGIKGQITFVAMRDIEIDEELCIDYAMIWSEPYAMNCVCKTQFCRNIITGDDWKLSELQNRYATYFSCYLNEKIKNQK